MTDKQIYKKIFNQCLNQPNMPFMIYNRELAKQIIKDAGEKYRNAKLFSYGLQCYICLTTQSRDYLLKSKQEYIKMLENTIDNTKAFIETLQNEI